jgi:hypothetical protein
MSREDGPSPRQGAPGGRVAASVGHPPTGCERGSGTHEDDGAQGWRGPGAVADEASRVEAGMGALRGSGSAGREIDGQVQPREPAVERSLRRAEAGMIEVAGVEGRLSGDAGR